MLRRLAPVLLAVAVLPACSGDQGATPLATLPPVTATATPTLPTPPPEADAVTPEGASAFAEFYLDQITAAYAQADPQPLRAHSDAGCGGCNDLIAAVEQLRDAGQRVEGGEYDVAFAVAPAPEVAGDFLVDIRYERSASATLDEAGLPVSESGPVPATDALMRVVREPDGWAVYGYRVVDV